MRFRDPGYADTGWKKHPGSARLPELLPEVGHLLLLPLEDSLLDPPLCLETLDPGLVAPRLFLQLRQLPVLPQVRLSANRKFKLNRGFFLKFFTSMYCIQHCIASSGAAPQIPLCRRMLGLNLGLLQLQH
jgi:hypothetical protein